MRSRLFLLAGLVESKFDALSIQFDAVALGQKCDIQLPLEAGTNFVYLEGALDVSQGLCGVDSIDGRQPGKCALGIARLDSQSEVFDFVTFGTQGDQTFQSLDHAVVIVDPDFVRFNGMGDAGPFANLAHITRVLKGGMLQTIPCGWAYVGSDVAVPTGFWHQFDGKFH